MTADGPCLVEMNCRARGGDGNWRSLAKALTGGYSQVEAAVDAFLDPVQVRISAGVVCEKRPFRLTNLCFVFGFAV